MRENNVYARFIQLVMKLTKKSLKKNVNDIEKYFILNNIILEN